MSSTTRKQTTAIYTGRKGNAQPTESDRQSPRPKRRISRRRWVAIGGGLLVLAILATVLIPAIRGPRFYRDALARSSSENMRGRQDVEAATDQLREQMQQAGEWELVLKEDDLNGWLATRLVAHAPMLRSQGVDDLRVQITATECRLAFRTRLLGVQFVIDGIVDFALTESENEIAMRIHRIGTGVIPLPVSRFTKSQSTTSLGSGARMRWAADAEIPTALIEVPDEIPNRTDIRLVITDVEQRKGTITLRGETRPR